MPIAPDIQAQLRSAADGFARRFGRRPTVAAAAPGRVNLIGEHTDYNDGFVLPLAIERTTVVVADPRPGSAVRVASTQVDDDVGFDLGADLRPQPPGWANYVLGPIAGCLARGLDPGGFDALVTSTVPLGSGLSSSAALQVAIVTLVEQLADRSLDPLDKAELVRQAEHDFAGVPCGLMDPLISTLGRACHALLIDCRSRETRWVAMSDPSIVVLIVDSHVAHELSGGEYRIRREQCEAAAAALGAPALRDATLEQLDAAGDRLDEVTRRRARHVISENRRTVDAAAALSAGDWPTLGRLMAASHRSLRDDFEVSTPELDVLVELATAGDGSARAIGSRMTGGGFGGCTVNLVRADRADRLADHITHQYRRRTGATASVFITAAADGARPLPLD